MYVAWTKNCKDINEKANFERQVQGASPVLKRIQELISEREADINKSEIGPTTYDTPSWAYQQAHNNGMREAFTFVKKLVDLDQQQIPDQGKEIK